jgi:hypothetical protein
VGRADLRVVAGAALPAASVLDADGFEAACVEAFVASWSARGFSPVFIENATREQGSCYSPDRLYGWRYERPMDQDRQSAGSD